DNAQATFISRVQLTWPNIPAFAQMGLSGMTLNTAPVWIGFDPQVAGATTTTDTNSKPGNPPFSSTSTAIRQLNAQDSGTLEASFNGPPLLATYVAASRYAITLTIDNPLNAAQPCVLTSTATTPTSTPIIPGQPSPTNTLPPDCASNLISIKFNSFDN